MLGETETDTGPWSPASASLLSHLAWSLLSLLPLTPQSLTSGLHLALFALIKIGPISEHATLLHARVSHVLIYFDDSVVLRYELVPCVNEGILKTLRAILDNAVGNKAIGKCICCSFSNINSGKNNKDH